MKKFSIVIILNNKHNEIFTTHAVVVSKDRNDALDLISQSEKIKMAKELGYDQTLYQNIIDIEEGLRR